MTFDGTLANIRALVVRGLYQARNQRVGQLPPPKTFNRMYLLGAARSYIILPPENISWLCPSFILTLLSKSDEKGFA